MTLIVYDATAIAMADAAVASLNATAGRVELRSGARPGVNQALTGTLIASFTLPVPAFGAATAGGSGATVSGQGLPITVNALAAHNFSTDGSDGYAATVNNDNSVATTGTVTGPGGGGDYEISNLAVANGEQVSLTAMSRTVPQL